MTDLDLEQRAELARELIVGPAMLPEAAAVHTLPKFDYGIKFTPLPHLSLTTTNGLLPLANVVVMPWTTAEKQALADVLTPGIPYSTWNKYTHNYETLLEEVGLRGPAHEQHCLGQYCVTQIGNLKVLCLGSNLHLATDAKEVDGAWTMPVKKLFQQVYAETKCKLLITTGTAGGLNPTFRLGDVAINTRAVFHTQRHFKDLGGKSFQTDFKVPPKYIPKAEKLIATLKDYLTVTNPPIPNWESPQAQNHRQPRIITNSHTSITATVDYFLFGTTTNGMDKVGNMCEMDDACAWLAFDGQQGPDIVSIRNASDPVISGTLDSKDQEHAATWCYKKYGYYSSVCSALACWAVIAGMQA